MTRYQAPVDWHARGTLLVWNYDTLKMPRLWAFWWERGSVEPNQTGNLTCNVTARPPPSNPSARGRIGS